MADSDCVHFHPEAHWRAAVRDAWERETALLAVLLPGADLQHVGSTAVPGSLTKGDLDIQVRVEAAAFADAEAVLSRNYARNAGSPSLPGFAAFEKPDAHPSIGLQLTAIGGEWDLFWRFREVLLARPDLRARYDDLKRAHEGKPMAGYRRAKDRFFEELRALPDFAAAHLP
ncbi:MAG: GrpB family protein [Deltaproteobacteria bacterium]|nr:GrpB family protein [Deltaproteobacteria bacterium]